MVWIVKENNNTQSILAKLLSKENITVQHGNFQTAFFDVKSRILGLPIWKDKGKDVNDLLVGHEVGHALYTPVFDPDALPTPHSYMNVVEDIRIERMIQSTYPGLVRCFRNGYSKLLAEDFFGIRGKNVSALGLPDRINLKAKLGSLIDVQFSTAESAVVNQCFNVKTWEDTIAAAKALYDFCKNQPDQQKQKQQSQSQGNESLSDTNGNQSYDTEKSDSESGEGQNNGKTDLSGDKQSDDGQSSDDGEQSESRESNTDSDQKRNSSSDDIKSDQNNSDSELTGNANSESNSTNSNSNVDPSPVTTLDSFAKKAKEMIDTSKDTLTTCFVSEPSDSEVFKQIISYKELFANRDSTEVYRAYKPTSLLQFKEFMSATNKYVAVLKKEFDLRKAAYQYSRAKESRSGILNVDKLHSYKIADDIFLSVTQLANAKNHGMVMFIDYSGSMEQSLPYVLKHLINLIVFCKAVGIPFRVYGFTDVSRDNNAIPDNIEGRIVMHKLGLLELASSEMSKADYKRALEDLYIRSKNVHVCGSYEYLSTTPLNETLIAAHKIIRKFQAEYSVQKTMAIFLTDGEGQNVNVHVDKSLDSLRTSLISSLVCAHSRIAMTLNGRRMKSSTHSIDHTTALIENLRITTGCRVIGFFIPTSSGAASTYIHRALGYKSTKNTLNTRRDIMSEFRKNKVVCIPTAYNYDDYFIVASGKQLDINDEELLITQDMGRNAIARAFQDFSKSKKVNRVFVTKFAEALA